MMKKTEKQQDPMTGDDIPIITPFEYVAGQIPRRAFALLLLATGGVIGMLGLALVTYFIIGKTDLINTLIMVIESIISIIFFLQALMIFKSSIKKGDMIVIREHRGGIMTFDKQPLTKKVQFDKKDPATEITVLWNGSGTEKQSGARILLLKEGNKSNENINLCVPETEWNKNLASMVRAKTFADIAENELLNNKSLYGLKWQDIVLIFVLLLIFVAIIIQVGLVPSMTTDAVIKKLSEGTMQQIIQSVLVPTKVA